MKKTIEIAMGGVLGALSVALLFLGSVVWILAYAMPMITGLIMIILAENVNKRTAYVTFVAVSIISILFLPDKECALTYIFFFGYYPILKLDIDKIKSKIARLVAKILIFNVSIVTSQAICFYVFEIPFDNFAGKWGILILLLCANLLYFVYERLLTVVYVLYRKKVKYKISKIIK